MGMFPIGSENPDTLVTELLGDEGYETVKRVADELNNLEALLTTLDNQHRIVSVTLATSISAETFSDETWKIITAGHTVIGLVLVFMCAMMI